MRTILGGALGRIPRPSAAMGVALLALVIAATGAAVAAIPNSEDGTITTCRDNRSGALRAIDAQGGQTCRPNETQLAWKDGITGKVANSDKLDDLDSADFQRSNAAAGGGLTGNYPNPQIAPNAVGAGELAPLPAVRALSSAGGQDIADRTFTLLQFPGEEFDQVGAGRSGEMHSGTPNTSRLTAPRSGIYRIDAQVGWLPPVGTPAGVRAAYFTKNGGGSCTGAANSAVAIDQVDPIADNSQAYFAFNHFGALLALNEGDYVEVCVRQDSGQSVTAASSFASMHFVSGR